MNKLYNPLKFLNFNPYSNFIRDLNNRLFHLNNLCAQDHRRDNFSYFNKIIKKLLTKREDLRKDYPIFNILTLISFSSCHQKEIRNK